MTDDISPYRLALWRYICLRDKLETEERLRQQNTPSHPAMCQHRWADLVDGMDDSSKYATSLNKETKP